MKAIAVSIAITILAGCATTHDRARTASAWPSNLTVGVAFLSAGVPSMGVGAGLFGYALAHKPSPLSGVDVSLFAPGAALFGVGIPFVTVGTILTISGALGLRARR